MTLFLRRHLSIKNVQSHGLMMIARQPKGSVIKPIGSKDATLALLITSKPKWPTLELKDYSSVKNKSPGNHMYLLLTIGLLPKKYGT